MVNGNKKAISLCVVFSYAPWPRLEVIVRFVDVGGIVLP
jgi:hypothetical protein